MCKPTDELTNEELVKISGGQSGGIVTDSGVITIRISYSATASRNQIRNALISELQALGIPTDKVPSASTLWAHGMESGLKAGVLVYECNSDGSMLRCYKG